MSPAEAARALRIAEAAASGATQVGSVQRQVLELATLALALKATLAELAKGNPEALAGALEIAAARGSRP